MKKIKEYYNEQKEILKEHVKGLEMSVCVFQIGNNEASNRYVKNKLKDFEDLGIETNLIKVPDNITFIRLKEKVRQASRNNNCFILQLPIPDYYNLEELKAEIYPSHDIDGLVEDSKVNPATPQGIMDYLDYNNYSLENKNVVILGRSELVGKPLAKMMLAHNANVTLLHSHTSEENKRLALKNADVIVSCVGKRNVVTDDMIRPDAFIIDVGINFDEDGHMVGDCESVTKCSKTPVPGGVGLLTRIAIIKNAIKVRRS